MACVVLMVAAACGGGNGDGGYDSPILNEDVPVANLTDLPDIEHSRIEMLDLMERVRDEVSRLAPATQPWRWNREESRSGCVQKESGLRGVSLATQNLISDAPLTDDEWAAAFPVVERLTRESGLGTVTVMANASRNHDVRFSSDDGRTLVFGTAEASVIAGRIECRRSATTATPAPSPLLTTTGPVPTRTTGRGGS